MSRYQVKGDRQPQRFPFPRTFAEQKVIDDFELLCMKDREAMGLTEIALLPGMEFARKNLSDFSTHVIERY